MRTLLIAALALGASTLAFAGAPAAAHATHDDYIDADQISETVETALRGALQTLESADLDPQTSAHIEAEIEAAMERVHAELAAYDGRRSRSLSEAEEEILEARIEAAMERVGAAMEQAAERIEEAHERRFERRND